MGMNPRISVIIPTLNSLEQVTRCVDFVLRSPEISPEVIVVDNGSSDGTSEELRRRFPRITVLRNERNEGFARAVNRAVREAHGSILCVLNDDTQVEPEAISRLAEFLERTPDAAAAGAQLYHSDGRKQNSFDQIPDLLSQFVNKSFLRFLFPSRYPSKLQEISEPTRVPSLVGACFAVRREVYDRIGPLDEDYFVFLEETDWCCRAREAGWNIYLVPDARVLHHQGQTGSRRSPHRAKVEYLRSMMTFFRKRRGFVTMAGYVAGLYLKIPIALLLAILGAPLALFGDRRHLIRPCVYGWVLGWLVLGQPDGWGLQGARL